MSMQPKLLKPTGSLLLEELEPRDLLWACLVGQVLDPLPAGASAPPGETLRDRLVQVWTESPRHRFDLLLQGTEMRCTAGVPSFLAGNICSDHGPSLAVIGRYEETLTPHVVDGRLIGTCGQATFALFVDAEDPLVFETITTTTTCLIQHVHPETGLWELGSAGTITASDGLFADLHGGFTGSGVLSVVKPGRWETRLYFSVSRPVAPGLAAQGQKWPAPDPNGVVRPAPAAPVWSEPFTRIRAGLKRALSPAAEQAEGAESDLHRLIAQLAAGLRQELITPARARPDHRPSSLPPGHPLLDFVFDASGEPARAPATGPRNGTKAPPLPNAGAREAEGTEAFVPSPDAVRREAALILNRRLSPALQGWATRYASVGNRNPYLWQWSLHGIDLTTLSCVVPDLRQELADTKVLGIMFTALVDDVADRQGEEKFLEQLLSFPFNHGATDFAPFSAEKRAYAEVAMDVWQEIEARTRRYPCYAQYAALFRYDHHQLFNCMRYSHILNSNLRLLNLLEHDLNLPHQMYMMILATFDLMASPDFDGQELGRLREAIWHAQSMGRIGNLLTTWERELGDADFSSGVYARAVCQGDLSVPDLLAPDRERIRLVIRHGGHEGYFLRRWQQHRLNLLATRPHLHSVDLQQLVEGLQRLLCSQLGSRGDY